MNDKSPLVGRDGSGEDPKPLADMHIDPYLPPEVPVPPDDDCWWRPEDDERGGTDA